MMKKMMMKKMYQGVLVASAVCGLSACGGSSNDGANSGVVAPKTQDVSIDFAVKAGSTPVNCGTAITALGSSKATAQLQDLRFYVSDVHLITADDKEVPLTLSNDRQWQRDGVALIDLENGLGSCSHAGTALTQSKIIGKAPVGTYTGVGFTVGLPSKLNHSNVATEAAPLDVTALAWSWQSGRKFFQLELNPAAGVTNPAQPDATPPVAETKGQTFFVHLGSSGCTGNPAVGETTTCTNPNKMSFHAHAFNSNTQRIVVDIAALLSATDITVNNADAPGCMSQKTDPECVAIFDKMKINLATGQAIDGGHGQSLFKVESK